MAKKKRKVRYDRIIILIPGCALIIGAIFMGISCITDENKTQTSDQPGNSAKEPVKDITQVEGYQILKDGGLSDEQIDALWGGAEAISVPHQANRRAIARSIEAAHGITPEKQG